jgi:redox-sensitive bicupin YhaK (pirin superfamily)
MSGFEIRRAATRGRMSTDWLDARFSFAFADYHDPARPRFGPLLALNEDRVQPASGFPMHPHRDLEIVMLPRRGAVEHHDSEGGHMIVRPGELQWMRAGRGIRHRQWNASRSEIDHHFQLWFEPSTSGLAPAVQRLAYGLPAPGTWRALVSNTAADGALDIGVAGTLRLGRADPDHALNLPARPGGLYLHLMEGRIDVQSDGRMLAHLETGDAIVFFDGVPVLRLEASAPSDLLRLDTGAVDGASGRLRAHERSYPLTQEPLP